MELKINGRVKLIMDLQSWDSGFTKREFVITTHSNHVCVQTVQQPRGDKRDWRNR